MREFTAGPRLGDTPDGDPRRQAVASLRGYAYQLYVSALAWIDLKSEHVLFLEVAEDYAVMADGALKGVQVKDTAESGSLTINNQDVLDALDSYVDLFHRNPGSTVSLRFLTTANLGRERDLADRVDGRGVLEYWRSAAAGADVAPLKAALLGASISGKVREFIEARGDLQLKEDLLRRIHWDCKQDGLLDVAAQLESSLIGFASDRLQLSPADCSNLPQVVVAEVLAAIVRPGSQRRLCLADLLRVCEAHSKTAISNSALARLLAAHGPTERTSTTLQAAALLEPIDSVPIPANIAPRSALIDGALSLVRQQQLLIFVGGSGLGKTLAARMTALKYGGRWLILDLRDVPAPETCRRLEAAFSQIATTNFDGIIVDDLNELESPAVCNLMARLVSAIRRRDASCIVTCYRQPSNAVADRLGVQSLPVMPVETLKFEEVRDLVQLAGGSSERAALLAFWHGGQGHPQLVRAFISIAQRIGWSVLESAREPAFESIHAGLKLEQRQLRQSLIERFDKGTRTLLYRVSLLMGRFDRSLALQVGEVSLAIDLAGESLDQLIGPWIDEIGGGRFRVSPLVDRVGEEILSSQEQKAVHRCAAEALSAGNTFNVSRANALYVHALKGSADSVLTKIALAVMSNGIRLSKDLVDWMPSLAGEPANRPIYAQNPYVSRYLRYAQVLLLSESDDDAHKLAAWTALCADMKSSQQGEESVLFEYMVLGSALMSPGLAQIFPNPIQLLERHHELTQSDPRFKSIISEIEQHERPEDGKSIVVSSLYFVTQAMEVRTIERQRKLFLELGSLSPEAREKYLGPPNNSQEALLSLVNAAWLAEVKAGTLDWARAADAFLEMSILAGTWDKRDLALYFRVARCVMIDEYGHQPEQAIDALNEAEAVFGTDAIISRGRAKVHFRNRRFAESLSIVEDASLELGKHDPLERMFICRETAISAANIGDWAKCRNWLKAALEASKGVRGKRLRPMIIGLRADHAMAAYRAGDYVHAIAEIGEVLSSLEEIEDDTSTRAIYCHRVIHHGLLWMYSQVSGEHRALQVEGAPPHMEAGMCSNSEPPESIRERPRASKITAWHLLAAIESHHLSSSSAREVLDRRLSGRIYPSLEFMTRNSLLESSVFRQNVDEFTQFISPWIDVCAHFYSHDDEMRASSPMDPHEGEVLPASSEQLDDKRIAGHTEDAVLSFAVRAAVGGQVDALRTLHAALVIMPLPGDGLAMLDRILRPDDARLDNTKADYICSAVRSVLEIDALSHEQLFTVTLRFVQAVHGSAFRSAVEPQVVRWVKQRWRTALNARFGFKTPNVSIPAISTALDLNGLGGVVSVLLAAEPALNVRLPTDFRHWLRSVS